MTNKQKFLKLVSDIENDTFKNIKYRIKNIQWLSKSTKISIIVLLKLEELQMTEEDLALQMGICNEYVSKILKGSENLNLETLTKLENVLNIEIFSENLKNNLEM